MDVIEMIPLMCDHDGLWFWRWHNWHGFDLADDGWLVLHGVQQDDFDECGTDVWHDAAACDKDDNDDDAGDDDHVHGVGDVDGDHIPHFHITAHAP